LTINKIVFDEVPNLNAEILVGAALPTKPPQRRLTEQEQLLLLNNDDWPEGIDSNNNIAVLPFFAEGQMLGSSLMQRYLTNGEAIRHFPMITLGPGGSAVLMLRVISDDAPAGTYRTTISATTDDGISVSIKLSVEVADVKLPNVDLWIRSWGVRTDQFPFETQQRYENDVKMNRALGVTVCEGFPVPESKADLFRKLGKSYFRANGLPPKYINLGYNGRINARDITDEDRNEIINYINKLVEQAHVLNLAYDEWWVELWDEPQEKNAELFGVLAGIIHQVDPKINIYMNPLFWRPNHAPVNVVLKHLDPYYRDLVDISVPVYTLVRDDMAFEKLWSTPRLVNALYLHPAERAGRRISWRAFELGFNGWGYYCYYSPRGNPWDIRSWDHLSYGYQMVFPGPQGPIVTPVYQTMLDGWEDFRLLTELRRQGKEQLVQELLAAFHDNQPFPELHQKALQALR
jgi:hypothetical protein